MNSGTITNTAPAAVGPAAANFRGRTSERFWQGALALSLAAAGLFSLVGIFLGLDTLLDLLPSDSWLNHLSTAGIVAAIVSLVLGAHCLDRIRELRLAARKERASRVWAALPDDGS